jgi:hypothetical protein
MFAFVACFIGFMLLARIGFTVAWLAFLLIMTAGLFAIAAVLIVGG